MNKIFALFLLFGLLGCINKKNNPFEEYNEHARNAMLQYKDENYKAALSNFKEAFRTIPNENVSDYFYAAATALHLEKDSLAKKLIIQAIVQTNASVDYFLNFKEFSEYRQNGIFREIEDNYQTYTAKFYENLKHPEIYREVDSLVVVDQKVRTLKLKNIQQTDSSNIMRLMEITQEYGWFKRGELILWHQRMSFEENNYVWSFFRPYINEQIQKGNIPKSYWVRFEDNIEIFEKNMQIYGMYWNQYDMYPIKNIKNVDERRKKVGLPPLWYMEKVYGIAPPSGYKYPKVQKL